MTINWIYGCIQTRLILESAVFFSRWLTTIWQPIAFISESLTPTQIRWSTIQKEAYAVFYCCTQLDYIIRDHTFTIYTDHLNITYMKQNPTSMVARWFIAIQELHFTVVFVPGTSNALADGVAIMS